MPTLQSVTKKQNGTEVVYVPDPVESTSGVFKNKVCDMIEEVEALSEELMSFYDGGFTDDDLEKLQNRWVKITAIVLRTI